MKKVIVIRHAKSSWELSLNDFQRPLLPIGVEKAIKVALKTIDFIPKKALIWSSSSVRATETAKIFVNNWKLDINTIIYKDNLYTFDYHQLEEIVKSCPNEYENLILFGHNSAITDFVNKFGDIFIDNVPTAGFVSIVFETTSWNTINKGKTDKIIFPRDN